MLNERSRKQNAAPGVMPLWDFSCSQRKTGDGGRQPVSGGGGSWLPTAVGELSRLRNILGLDYFGSSMTVHVYPKSWNCILLMTEFHCVRIHPGDSSLQNPLLLFHWWSTLKLAD